MEGRRSGSREGGAGAGKEQEYGGDSGRNSSRNGECVAKKKGARKRKGVNKEQRYGRRRSRYGGETGKVQG